jgi:hypothetical protein
VLEASLTRPQFEFFVHLDAHMKEFVHLNEPINLALEVITTSNPFKRLYLPVLAHMHSFVL